MEGQLQNDLPAKAYTLFEQSEPASENYPDSDSVEENVAGSVILNVCRTQMLPKPSVIVFKQ